MVHTQITFDHARKPRWDKTKYFKTESFYFCKKQHRFENKKQQNANVVPKGRRRGANTFPTRNQSPNPFSVTQTIFSVSDFTIST